MILIKFLFLNIVYEQLGKLFDRQGADAREVCLRALAGEHFVADAAVVFAHGNEQPFEFRRSLFREAAHLPDRFARFFGGLIAEALVGDGHKLFSVDVEDHIDGRVLRGFVAVVFMLAVVALGFDVGLRMDMAGEVDGDAIGDVFKVKAVYQIADGAVAGGEDAVAPRTIRRIYRLFANGNERSALTFYPIFFRWRAEQLDRHWGSGFDFAGFTEKFDVHGCLLMQRLLRSTTA